MLKKLEKNNHINNNQLRTKLLYKNLFNIQRVKSIHLNCNLRKLRSHEDDSIIEGMFLLEFFTLLKSNINYYKRMYQEVSLQLMNIMRKSYSCYLLMLLKLFCFPLLIRRNITPKISFDKLSNYYLSISSINLIEFLPNIFYK